MRNQNGFLKIVIVLLVLVVIGSAFYFLILKTKNTKNISTLKPIGLASQQPATISELGTFRSTDNWKTYTNNEYKFSFKYPQQWIDETDPTKISEGNKEFTLKTDKGGFVTGTILEGEVNKPSADNWIKEIDLDNNYYLLISYSNNLGPDSIEATEDTESFNLVLSSFELTE